MTDLFRIFFSVGVARQLLSVTLLLLITLSQSAGLAALFPILALVDDDPILSKGGIKAFFSQGLHDLGIHPSLGVLLTILIAATTLRVLFVSMSTHYIALEAAKIARDLRTVLIEALMRARWAYFTSQPIGRFANSISEEATEASECYMLSGVVISQLARLAIYLIFITLVQWQVALAIVIFVPLIWLAMRKLRGQARRVGRRRVRRTRELSERIADSLTNMKPLKATGRERHFLKLIKQDAREVNRSLRRETFTEELLKNIQEPIIAAILCVGLYVLIRVWNQPLSTTLTLTLLAVGALDSLQVAQAGLQKVLLQRSAFWSIHNLINDVQKIEEWTGGNEMPSLLQKIELQKIELTLNERHILRGVDLTIPARGICTLIGPSGAGKTTIADIVAGLHRPDVGQILIDGQSLEQLDIKAWRSHIGYVPQENILFNDTIRNNICLGDPAIDDEAIEQALVKAGLWDFVAALPDKLDHIVGERGTMLSGGQRQRISIARALVARPWLLILDEATSALDHNTAMEIRDQVRKFSGETTILVITHQPIWLEVSDTVYQISEGGRAERIVTAAA